MLRAVLLVNLSYRKNYKFACLMTLYRRGVDGGAVVKGVVNLGGVSMSPGSARQVEWSRPHQKLPLVPLHGRTEDPESQWGADNRSFVEVPAADILYQALPDPTTPTEARENLYIDVWRMYRDIS
ncbi:hypothetical protein JG688_00005051 [Phytophthora aleatoria]|uniref:Uncharacterized protein n=1 Tax=Phytophthora aleatoria TaxID=2496075 RepID=A0A8J5ISB9_9STRA|nr:hypothetical protein JG688_00005051 [Phytophthora aleatoria]